MKLLSVIGLYTIDLTNFFKTAASSFHIFQAAEYISKDGIAPTRFDMH